MNPKTKNIIKSRDIVWLGKSYGKWSTSKADLSLKDDDSDNETDSSKDKPVGDTSPSSNYDPKKGKLDKALRETSRLKSWFKPNPNPTRFLENNSDSGREFIVDRADVPLNLIEKPREPETFEEAYFHPNIDDRSKWRDAISKELQ